MRNLERFVNNIVDIVFEEDKLTHDSNWATSGIVSLEIWGLETRLECLNPIQACMWNGSLKMVLDKF
jgi:protein-disulfide isomerase-like protein with CxxC motif